MERRKCSCFSSEDKEGGWETYIYIYIYLFLAGVITEITST